MNVVVPEFKVEQTSDHVLLLVYVPISDASASTGSARAIVDNGIFGVTCGNAHLPLVFSNDALVNASASLGQSQQQPSSHAHADAGAMTLELREGVLHVRMLKAQPGKHIDELDTLKASLFAVPATGDAKNDEEARLAGLDILRESVRAINEDDKSISGKETNLPLPTSPLVGTNVKTRMHECATDLPLGTFQERMQAAVQQENNKWDEGMYLDSFIDQDGEISHLIQASIPQLSTDIISSSSSPASTVSQASAKNIGLLLVELLLAYSYDRRTTLGEPTVESGWTIAVLCRSLVASCLPDVQEGSTCLTVVQGSIRRQLCYGLYRNWHLSQIVVRDVVQLLRTGNKGKVIAALQAVHRCFDAGDDDALEIYTNSTIEPLIFWFNILIDSQSLIAVSDEVESALTSSNKDMIAPQWDLEALEEAAKEAIANGEGQYI